MLSRPQFKTGLQVNDAIQEIVLQFNVGINSDQVYKNTIEVYENTTGTLSYTKTTTSFLLESRIPSNSLLNGKEYRVRVKTHNSKNDESQWSDYMILKCYTTPTVEITNIPIDISGERVLRNQTYTFIGSYYQKENIGMKSYRFKLLDADKVILKVFNEVYSNDPSPLPQEVTGLRSKEKYYIQIVTLNQANIEASSIMEEFYVDYDEVRITNVLDVKNDKENALVNISAQIIQMLLTGENHKFEQCAAYLRNRTLGEIATRHIGEVNPKTMHDITKERVSSTIATYSNGIYIDNSHASTYAVTTDPKTLSEIFFINLETEGAKVWIDKDNGLNMNKNFTMNIHAEGILENKDFLVITGKDSITRFSIYDSKLHCIEDNKGIIRHSICEINRYVVGKPMHIFIQKDLYMRIQVRMMV